MHQHVAVWLDHSEAKIFHVDAELLDRAKLHVAHHLHHPTKTGGHAETHRQDAVDHPFFQQIASHLADAGEVLLCGPSNAKTELVAYLEKHDKPLAAKIVAIEPADHPTDGQLVAHARKYFRTTDPLRS